VYEKKQQNPAQKCVVSTHHTRRGDLEKKAAENAGRKTASHSHIVVAAAPQLLSLLLPPPA
jgi:hypothetical protein